VLGRSLRLDGLASTRQIRPLPRLLLNLEAPCLGLSVAA